MDQNELLIENIDRLHTTQKNSIHKIEKRTDMQISRFFISGDIKGAIEYMRDREEFKDILPAYVAIFEDRKYRTYEVPDALNNILRLYQIYFRDTFYCGIPEQDAVGKLLAELRALLNIPDADEALLAEQLRSAFEAEGYHALFGKTQAITVRISGGRLFRPSTVSSYRTERRNTRSTFSRASYSGAGWTI